MTSRLVKIAIASATFACGMSLSVDSSGQRGVSLSVESAQARVGRPLTPVSVAGVARRQNRRAAYGYGYGAVGAGLAVGAATVAAATSDYQPYGYAPGYRAYAEPYHEGGYYEAHAADPTLAGGYSGGFYAESPWGYYECQPPHPYDCQPYSHVGWYH